MEHNRTDVLQIIGNYLAYHVVYPSAFFTEACNELRECGAI